MSGSISELKNELKESMFNKNYNEINEHQNLR